MKKKVAVVLNTVNFGGVAKSLIDFLNLMKDSCDIDLILFRDDGDLIDQIPKEINIIIPKGYMGCFVDNSKICKKLGKKQFFFKRVMSVVCRFTHYFYSFSRYATRHSEKFKGYDVAISYAKVCPPNDCWCGAAEFVLNNIEAKKKYVINHDDFFRSNFFGPAMRKIKKFDTMFAVSQGCMQKIIGRYPKIKNKLDYMYNPVNTDAIIKKSNESTDIKLDQAKFQMAITGRIVGQKNHLELMDILADVKKETGDNFVLNIIGDGSLRNELEQKIADLELENNVKIWGFQKNPYAIVKQCKLSLLNSVLESFGIVYIESMILGVPVLTNNVTPAKEIIQDYGVVAKDNNEFKDELVRLIKDEKYLNSFKNKLNGYKYDNVEIKNKWLKYIDGEEK